MFGHLTHRIGWTRSHSRTSLSLVGLNEHGSRQYEAILLKHAVQCHPSGIVTFMPGEQGRDDDTRVSDDSQRSSALLSQALAC